MGLTKLAIERPCLITMIILLMVFSGIASSKLMGVDLMPTLNYPVVNVLTTYTGASPDDIETLITKKIEDSVSTLDKIDHITSSSMEGMSNVTVQFKLDADADLVPNDVQRNVFSIINDLPDDADQPIIKKVDPNATPILQIALRSNIRSIPDLYILCDRVIKDKLSQVGGVGDVQITGEKVREIQVSINSQKLQAMNLNVKDICDALEKASLNLPSGKLNWGKKEFTVRTDGEFKLVNEIPDILIPVKDSSSRPVYVKDVATVKDTYKEQRVYTRFNGGDCIGLLVLKQTGANTVKTAEQVMKKIEELKKRLGDDLTFDVAYNQTDYTKDSLGEVKENLVEGIILTAIVLLFFIQSFRNTIIVLFSIPTCLITAFTAMYFCGFSENMMSLIGLATAIGILVDDSIVVLENIHRHLEMGEEPKEAAFNGRSEIGFAAICITLVDVVVFTPIAFLTGITGQVFRQFALVVVATTLLSLFVSFTLTPMLASRWSRKIEPGEARKLNPVFQAFERFNEWLKDLYRKYYLPWGLKHRTAVLLIAVVSLAASCALVPMKLIGIEFTPKTDSGEFVVDCKTPVGTALVETDKVARRIEKFILEHPATLTSMTTVGKATGRNLYMERGNVFQFQVKLKEKKERNKTTDQVTREILDFTRQLAGADVRVLPFSMFGSAARAPFEIQVRGKDLDEIASVASGIQEITKKMPGVQDVRNTYEPGKPQLNVRIDREKAAIYGLTVSDVAKTLRTHIDGNVPCKYRWGDEEYDIRVFLPESRRVTAEDVLEIPIMSSTGQMLKVRQVASVRNEPGPSEIDRYDKERSISVSANLSGTTLGVLLEAVLDAIGKTMNVPPSIDLTKSGDYNDMRDMFQALIIALIASILLIYMLMVALYESYIYPFIIMFSVPVALTGALSGLALTGKSLSMFSMVGLIMLMGIVAKNAILIVDYTNTLKAQGMKVYDALIEAGATRLRPILMTTAAMVFGTLPLAMATGKGSEMRSGMGVVLIGGLLSSLVFTLVVVPVVYTIVDQITQKLARKAKAPE